MSLPKGLLTKLWTSCLGQVVNLKRENKRLVAELANLAAEMEAAKEGDLAAPTRSQAVSETHAMLTGSAWPVL